MTLSTRAEHEAGRRADAMEDGLSDAVQPTKQAREFVRDLEGTRDDPAVVTSPEAKAEELASKVERETRHKACAWDDSAVGDALAERFGDRAGGLALELMRESPCIEVLEE